MSRPLPERPVAIKVLHSQIGKGEGCRERFRREAQEPSDLAQFHGLLAEAIPNPRERADFLARLLA